MVHQSLPGFLSLRLKTSCGAIDILPGIFGSSSNYNRIYIWSTHLPLCPTCCLIMHTAVFRSVCLAFSGFDRLRLDQRGCTTVHRWEAAESKRYVKWNKWRRRRRNWKWRHSRLLTKTSYPVLGDMLFCWRFIKVFLHNEFSRWQTRD